METWKFKTKIHNPASVCNMDSVYTVPDLDNHDIEFGQFEVIFTLATFSMISCY